MVTAASEGPRLWTFPAPGAARVAIWVARTAPAEDDWFRTRQGMVEGMAEGASAEVGVSTGARVAEAGGGTWAHPEAAKSRRRNRIFLIGAHLDTAACNCWKELIAPMVLRKSASVLLRARSSRTAGPTGSSPAAPPGTSS